jgi:hypothetical protein
MDLEAFTAPAGNSSNAGSWGKPGSLCSLQRLFLLVRPVYVPRLDLNGSPYGVGLLRQALHRS